MDAVAELLAAQAGVLARRQALEAGLDPVAVKRLVRRREWAVVHPGVYVDHTGPPTLLQREWAAVLACWPAALSHESAARVGAGRPRGGLLVDQDTGRRALHVAVHRERRITAPAGVVVHRLSHLDEQTLWHPGVPRVRLEHALLDVAGRARTDLDAVAVLADACGARRTTPARLLAALGNRQCVPRRARLLRVLDDLAGGTCSVLEHEYLTRVERAHCLPVGVRQRRGPASGRPSLQDVAYEPWGLVVELDGRAHHSTTTDRDRDLERDLAVAAGGATTIRLGWGQVLTRPCRTAAHVGTLLRARGWTGVLRHCRACGGSGRPS